MPGEGRNYERNREIRPSRRRFKLNSNSDHDQRNTTPNGSNRSRSAQPVRSTKSMSNLSAAVDEEPETTGGGQSVIARLVKYFKSPTKETPVPQRPIPVLITPDDEPPKKSYFRHLGLGEYVGAINADLDDSEEVDLKPMKSRSLINISMTHLYADDAEDRDSKEKDPDEITDQSLFTDESIISRKVSGQTTPDKLNFLGNLNKLIQFSPTPSNLVKFMDNVLINKDTYQNQVTSFCGGLEDHWVLPALVVSTCDQFNVGTICNVHRISDFATELAVTINWVRNLQSLCQSQLKRYHKIDRRQRRITFQNQNKQEKEAQLKELLDNLNEFIDSAKKFQASQNRKKSTVGSKAVLIASHSEGILSLQNLLPMRVTVDPDTKKGVPKYRKLKNESVVYVKMWKNGQLMDTSTETVAFLFTDYVILAKASKSSIANISSSSIRYNNVQLRPWKSISNTNLGSYEIIACLPLVYIGLPLPPPIPPRRVACAAELLGSASELTTRDCVLENSASPSIFNRPLTMGVTTHSQNTPTPSCSSGISSISFSETEQEVGTGGMEMAGGGLANTITLWWPPCNRCQLQFVDFHSYNDWRLLLQQSVEHIQSIYANQTLRVKVQNELDQEKHCVHKYLAINLNMTVRELKDKALKTMNVFRRLTDVELRAVCSGDGPMANSKITLSDEDRPFLLALYATMSMKDDRQENLSVAITELFSKNIYLPIPIVFSIHDNSIRKASEFQLSQELLFAASAVNSATSSPRLRHHERRPQTYHLNNESGSVHRSPGLAHMHHALRSKISKSSTNLTEISFPNGGTRNRVRQRSRIRLGNHRISDFQEAEASPLYAGSPLIKRQFQMFKRLPEEIWPDCRVPLSIMSLFVIVFYKGSSLEGIFRRPVQQSKLEAMIVKVDENEEALTPDDCPPLYAANILKKFFREIPGHLLIDEKWDDWCKLNTLDSDEEISAHCKKMMRQLPSVNQSLLTFLLFTIAQIRVNEPTNQMSKEALVRMWAPNLIERPFAPPSEEDTTTAIKIVSGLLGPFTDIFCLKSVEFRQKLTVCFEEIWGQITKNERGESKTLPPPEAETSILETEGRQNSKDEKAIEVNESDPTKILTRGTNKRLPKREKLIHSLSADAEYPSVVVAGETTSLFLLGSPYSRQTSQDSGELPPPIPRRLRRSSPVHSLDEPPPLPKRQNAPGMKLLQITTNDGAKRKLSQLSLIDRRRSLLSQRHNSKSPVSQNSDPIGRKCSTGSETSDSLLVCSGESSSPSASPKLTFSQSQPSHPCLLERKLLLSRSTSDVDSHIHDRCLSVRRRHPLFTDLNSFQKFDFTLINLNNGLEFKPRLSKSPKRSTIGGNAAPKNPLLLKRDTSWVCSHWQDGRAEKETSPSSKDNILSQNPENMIGALKDPSLPPTNLKISRSTLMHHNESCERGNSKPKSPSSCRRVNSTFEQVRVNERPLKSYTKPESSLVDQSGVQLSRGSSHASNSSTSTIINFK